MTEPNELADPQLRARYRQLPDEAPPPELDAVILAASRRGLRPGHWGLPLSLAAVLVLSVSVTLRLAEQEPALEPLRAQTAPTEVPSAIPQAPAAPAAPQEPLAPSSSRMLSGKTTADAPAASERHRAAEPARPAAAPLGSAIAPASPPPAAQAATPAAAGAGFAAPAATAASSPAATAASSPAATAASSPAAVAESSPAAAAALAPARDRHSRTENAEAEPRQRLAMRERTAAVAAAEARASDESAGGSAESPQSWLNRIAALREKDRHKEADEQFAAFRRQYPAYPIDPLLLQKVAPR